MFSKQSRLIRSSSLGGSVDSLKNPVWSTERKHHSNASKLIQTPVIKKSDAAVVKKAAVAVARPVKAAKMPRESIFTLSSPPRERVENRMEERIKYFLDKCGLCKKNIPENEDRYMYGPSTNLTPKFLIGPNFPIVKPLNKTKSTYLLRKSAFRQKVCSKVAVLQSVGTTCSPPSSVTMNRAMPEQVEISSEDSSPDADDDIEECKQPNADYAMDQPAQKLTSEDWLLRRAEVYQEYMNLIPVPTLRGSLIPFTSWIGLGRSIKQLYGQPLHYLTNISLKQWDQSRIGGKDEQIPLDTIIHPCKAEASIWLMEEDWICMSACKYMLLEVVPVL
ncbi:unnamed protein product [Fraxinus pennsylvanica]|uniref:FLZ-type domain-containing protein n=1 Tax=Fraxinus pennsylvanica TaxID=56036 RepID=A0AAD1ZW54_9LAMI|nr:unnamed protein product [Fraxinus pennsylvanica]